MPRLGLPVLRAAVALAAATVSAVRVYGPTGDCSYAEAAELVERPDADPSAVLLAVEASEQLEVGARYRLSAEVGGRARRAGRTDEGGAVEPSLRLPDWRRRVAYVVAWWPGPPAGGGLR